MKKFILYILLGVFGLVILFIMLQDFLTDSLKKEEKNPYAYELGEWGKTDSTLIGYREIRRINLNLPDPMGISYYSPWLGIAYQKYIQLIDTSGMEKFRIPAEDTNTCLTFSRNGSLYVGSGNRIRVIDLAGNLIRSWEVPGENVILTSLAVGDKYLYAADAGNQRVHRYSPDGTWINSFDGTGRLEGKFGFIIPSPFFDLVLDRDDELWIANPGLLQLENYTEEGTLRAFWGEASFDIRGFSGCCNPAHFIILPDGSFVTSEKGLTRIKVYKSSGELDCVVAGSESFPVDTKPPDLAADETGRIYVLDMDRKAVRIFKRTKT